ncbi:MAG: hypothetical protein L0G82_20670, partial [Pseudomonas sp.]|nr:hypothetical protein [Pseudomonas sp.]
RDPMINSHLLYRLSYRGTSVFQLCCALAFALPLQRRAILRSKISLSTPANCFYDNALQREHGLLYVSSNCGTTQDAPADDASQDSP